ncbi:DUF4158 domain-containing protein [Streptomyces hebeiensis]
MTSIERSAYPRFKRLITAHELHLFFSPTRDELEQAAGATDGDGHLLALLLMLMLKSYQRMGCFPGLEDVPEQVLEFVRRQVELPEGTLPVYRAERTANFKNLTRRMERNPAPMLTAAAATASRVDRQGQAAPVSVRWEKGYSENFAVTRAVERSLWRARSRRTGSKPNSPSRRPPPGSSTASLLRCAQVRSDASTADTSATPGTTKRSTPWELEPVGWAIRTRP